MWARLWSNRISVLRRRGPRNLLSPPSHVKTQQDAASQKVSTHRKPTLPPPGPRLWDFEPPELRESNFCFLSHSFCGIWLGQPKLSSSERFTLVGRIGREGFSWFPQISDEPPFCDEPPHSSPSCLLPIPSFQGQAWRHCSEAPQVLQERSNSSIWHVPCQGAGPHSLLHRR